MSRVLVWDLPTRVFHWLLTAGLAVCFAIAILADEHSQVFTAHMILGLALGFMVALRIIWGFVGTKYARFDSFSFGPTAVFGYLKDAFTETGRRHVGHNPGSSYSIFAMLILIGVVVATGLLMSNGSEAAEELHAVGSYVLLAFIVVHILGVAWYSLRHRENITLSMISGFKEGAPTDAIRSSRPITALAFVAAVGIVTVALFRNYDSARGETKLPGIGIVIQLGETESGEGGRGTRHDD